MQLVIVESPTKAKTISKFLGSDFMVRSSFGHVRDLPKSKLGVDVEKNFVPHYIVPAKAKKVIAELKDALKHSDEVILASDEDREGEAIAWHLAEVLDLGSTKRQAPNLKRIVFHEITKSAIEQALKHPRGLDMNLVDAQQARRILDRLVGYELSPFLWRKVRFGLSAGRVQSVAVRLVVEREREIQKFKKDEYWTIEATLSQKSNLPDGQAGLKNQIFRAKLIQIDEKKLDKLAIRNEQQARELVVAIRDLRFVVRDVASKEFQRHPSPPFTTSTLQQEASRKLGWSAKQTMMAAQKLYETGLITYMRTDSLNMAESAIAQAASVVTKHFGKEYSDPRRYTTKSKGAQEAHEAIRPTDFSVQINLPAGRQETALYNLIWKRAIASQMASAQINQTTVDIEAGTYLFRATGSVVLFDGFIRAYTEGKDEEEEVEGQLPELIKDEPLDLKKLEPLQHFTEPPPRYTDATLVKALESHGIGRPSTYAPTLSTIQDRGYVEKVEKKYQPTEIGFLVSDLLVKNFPHVVDINFTSHIEEELDGIAEGKMKWEPVVKEFYQPFHANLVEKTASVGKVEIPGEVAAIKALEEKTLGERCPICGKGMVVKRSRFGYFLSCSDFPTCKGTAKILNKTGFQCPNCHVGEMVERKSRGRGRIFYGCTRYPECTFLMGKKPESDVDLQEALKVWKEKPPKVEKGPKKS